MLGLFCCFDKQCFWYIKKISIFDSTNVLLKLCQQQFVSVTFVFSTTRISGCAHLNKQKKKQPKTNRQLNVQKNGYLTKWNTYF